MHIIRNLPRFIGKGIFRNNFQNGQAILCRYRATTTTGISSEDAKRISFDRKSAVLTPETESTLGIDFRDTKTAYRSKTFGQVVRAYLVFKVCSIRILANNQKELLVWTRKLLGRYLFRKLMRVTVYEQFSGGETEDEILSQAGLYKNYGVLSMFAYTAGEMHGGAKGGVKFDEGNYFKRNYDEILKSIHIASKFKTSDGPVTKVTAKFTAIAPTEILTSLTTVMNQNVAELYFANEEDFSKRVNKATPVMQDLQKKMNLPMPFPSLEFDSESKETWLTSTLFHLALSQIDGTLTDAQLTTAFDLWNSLMVLSKTAAEHGVSFMWDAEQSYTQHAIELMILDLQRLLNKHKAVVHGTYQCYLKKTLATIRRDLDLAEQEGFRLALKTVRGAYLDEERQLAKDQGYEDPVNPSYEATTNIYHAVVEEVLQRIVNPKPNSKHICLTVATHNENTCKHVAERMAALGLPPNHESISFAQLIGMRDHIAFLMASTSYPTQKLIHYGDVEENVAHLSRRMKENKSGFPAADLERDLFAAEVWRRLKTRQLGREKHF